MEKSASTAESAVQAFYTIDYREPPEKWIKGLCEFTTEKGCRYADDFYKRYYWPKIEKNKIRASVIVFQSVNIVSEPDYQLWEVLIEPGETWIGLDKPEHEIRAIYVELRQDTDSQWKMDHIVTDIEYDSLLEELSGE